MIDEAIKGISEAKISGSGILLASSGSAMTYGVITLSYLDLILGFAGFMLSVFSFHYEYHHAKEKKTRGQVVSEAIRHLIFGTFAFPAAYSFMFLKFELSFAINVFVAVVASYSVMKLVSVGVDGAIAFIKAWFGGKK